jgi:hypothetical protein
VLDAPGGSKATALVLLLPAALSEYLGHADPGFTLRTYTHLMPTSAERPRRPVDAVLRPRHDDGPASSPKGAKAGPASSDGLWTG